MVGLGRWRWSGRIIFVHIQRGLSPMILQLFFWADVTLFEHATDLKKIVQREVRSQVVRGVRWDGFVARVGWNAATGMGQPTMRVKNDGTS